MYIEVNGTQYPCQCRPGAAMVYRGLPEDFPAPVVGPVALCRDDGFVLREDDPADYLRQTFDSGTLTLTNAPEPVLVEPQPVVPNTVVTMEDMAEAILDHEARLLMAEAQ